jgi:anti-sigma-K factor RskA
MTPEHPRDELPALLLGELPSGEVAELRGHLHTCDRCRADLDAITLASSALRDAATLPIPDATELPDLDPSSLTAEPAPRPAPVAPARPSRSDRRKLGIAAAVILVVALVGGYASFSLSARDTPAEQEVQLTAVGDVPARGDLKIQGPMERRVISLVSAGLPEPGAGEFYQVWLMRPDGGNPVALGVLSSDNTGIWSLPEAMAASYAGQAFDVSLEREDGNPAHSGRSVLRGTLPV